MILRLIFALCVLVVTAAPAAAARITVAVASNFLTTAQDISAVFEAQSGHEVDLVHGSSGKLFAQISSGAPYDVFLSADRARPARLVEKGLSADPSPTLYALGKLALVHGDATEAGTLEDILSRPGIRIAIADPALAPYGAAAREVLRLTRRADWDSGVVFAENVGQAFAFVATGNADVGLVALSLALTFEGDIWVMEVPGTYYQLIEQDAVLLSRAVKNPTARAFLAFLASNIAAEILADAGYEVPP